MDAARRVVLIEGGMGLFWLAYGALSVPVATLRTAWWLAALAATGTVALGYAEEHRMTGWDPYLHGGVAIAVVLGGVAVVGGTVAVTDLHIIDAVGAAMAGMGAGLLGYRLFYGVIRPVPQSRLDGAEEQSV